MNFAALAYVGIRATDLNEWAGFATRNLGLQIMEHSRSSLALRMDERKQRLFVHPAEGGGVSVLGWEVHDQAALGRVAATLEAANVPYQRMSSALCGQRFVQEGIHLKDPAGNVLEIVYGVANADDGFAPGRALSGFVTGPLGLGHAVLTVPRIDEAAAFYQDVLGFKLSDYVVAPFKALFFHVNPRHHSFALIEMDHFSTHHLMMELYNLDDVGQGYDITLTDPKLIGTTLGRHTNDFMTSFYTNTPSKFMIEYGWGGRVIDPNTWKSYQLTDGPSLWGHERAWLDEKGREKAREMRMSAAARGVREPVYVTGDNYKISEEISCNWWNSLTR